MALRVAALALAISGAVFGLPPVGRPRLMEPGVHGISAPLWLQRPIVAKPPPEEHEPRRIPLSVPEEPVTDPVVQRSVSALLAPPTGLVFEGIGLGTVSVPGAQPFQVEHDPPDPSGDVGPNHYVEIVNSSFAVFSRAGTLLLGPLPTQAAFAGLGGACETGTGYDGIVLYDPLADRWLISQLGFLDGSAGPFWECIAVSRTPDPTGQYAQYGFRYDDFNDYPKLGVWSDAYYATYNMFGSSSLTSNLLSRQICAFDRARMLAGKAAAQMCVEITSGEVSGLTPADIDGELPPPPGEPALALGFFGVNSLVIYRYHVDWEQPQNSSMDAVLLDVAPFQPLCASRTPYCVPQLNGPVLDGLSDRMMFRVAYRNMGAYESVIANHNVVADRSGGVRWYEIRDPAGAASVYQQGTYAPDSNSRWMGSAAMDRGGNIGLGFSLSSAQQNVAIGLTGRTPADPPGVMGQGETTIPGGGAENQVRWGDYSTLSVDPVDDCTFWYTAQYIPFDGTRNWRTRVATFQLPGCTAAPDFAVWISPDRVSAPRGGTATFTVSTAALRHTAAANPIQLAVSGLGAGLSATVTPAVVAAGAAATVSIASDSTVAIGGFPFTVAATAGGVTQTTAASAVIVDSDFMVSVDKPDATIAFGGNTSVQVSPIGLFGVPEVVLFSASGLPRGVTAYFDPNYARVGDSTTLHFQGGRALFPGLTNIKVVGAGAYMSHAALVRLRTLSLPQARILFPLPYSNLSGTTLVSVTGDASLGTTLERIEMYLDGQRISGLSAQSSPAELHWNTNAANDGPHLLTARAFDAEGNHGSSPPVAIWIQNKNECGCSSDGGAWEALGLLALLAAVRRRRPRRGNALIAS